jgi:hypothetical protein
MPRVIVSMLCIVLLAGCQTRLDALKKVREKIQSTLSVCTQKAVPSPEADATSARTSFPAMRQEIEDESVIDIPVNSTPNSWDAKMAIW